MDADKIRVTVLGISYSHLQQGAYLLLLAEENGSRRVPVVVGKSEAQSIAIRMEKLAPPRPMTHDLMVNITEHFGVGYEEVYIYRFDNGIFYSTLAMTDGVKRVEIDARTSDAIAIAMRTHIPIYMSREVLQQAGFEAADLGMEEKNFPQEAEPEATDDVDYEHMSDAELEQRKAQAVAVEAYEEAAMIQQILNKRKL